MENPYQSPLADASATPLVSVLFRKHWVGRNFEQVYRFECQIGGQDTLREKIIDFFLDRNTSLSSSSEGRLVFERRPGSWLSQLFSRYETIVPQTIHVSLQESPSGFIITCHYKVRALIPNVLIPPHYLEKEVRELASECNA